MGYVKTDKKGDYVQANNGNKFYLRNPGKFVPIDYSKPKASQPGIAQANPIQKALNSAMKNNKLT